MSEKRTSRPWVESCHEIILTIDGYGVDVHWTCSATEGAWCRLTCPEQCEEWFEDHVHALVDAGECVVLPWLENNAAWDETYSGPPQQVRCGPIFVEWDNPGYRWSYDPFGEGSS